MTEPEDIDVIAAEYVLGTLDGQERIAAAARRQREPVLDAAIVAWEQRLGPLAEVMSPVSAPPYVKVQVESRIDRLTQGFERLEMMDMARRLGRWKTAAISASALAASLLLVIGVRESARDELPKSYVAVLQKDAASPAFLLTVDLTTKQLTIRPVAAEAQAGHSYELWLVHETLPAPKSLGVVDGRDFTIRPTLAAYDRNVIAKATFAVSLEPVGGSRTGSPTTVLYAGKLVQSKP